MSKYLIVGNSAGGVGCAEAIRQVDPQGSIGIVSDEPHVAYSRPAIAEVLCQTKTFAKTYYRPESFYEKLGIQTYLGRTATRLDPEARWVELDGAERVPFEKLLIATGGTPIRPPLEGADKEGVYNFTTIADAERLRARLDTVGKRVVVIGAGLIGSSCSDALARTGASPTVVELRDRVLSLLLDEDGSRLALAAMQEWGIQAICNHTVKQVLGRSDNAGSVGGVLLDHGERLDCDAVVVAVGVFPRKELAEDAGIRVNRGILVDEQMQTNVPGIYSCGDVAEAYDFVLGANRVVPIWPGAYQGGRVAGFNMAGRECTSTQATVMNSLKYFGVPLVSAGEIHVDGQPEYEVLKYVDPRKQLYKKVVLRDNRVIGFVFSGDVERSGIVYALLREQVDVEEFKDLLVGDGFDLIHLPRKLRLHHYLAATRE